MITLLTGPNTYAIREFLDEVGQRYGPHASSLRSGSELNVDNLPQLLQGTSLFAEDRLVVIKEASSNKIIWTELASWLDKVPDEVHLVIVEKSPDKRTKTYKVLQKSAQKKDATNLNEFEATKWLEEHAKKQNKNIAHNEAAYLVDRVGVDQWQLRSELEKLLLMNDTSKQRIDDIVEAAPQANVFLLIDAALQGRREMISSQIKILETQEDPYRLFGLLSSQVFQLVVLQNAKDLSVDAIAKDISTHPYPLKKLKPLADKLSKREVLDIVTTVASLDLQLKRSAGDPWLLLERALVKISVN